MIGRENPEDNDLFFTCSLIDYIARRTRNRRADLVKALGNAYKRLILGIACEKIWIFQMH